ncbi:MAG: helix-turn-helix transcriptional regulator [Lachnospiraceae bacterium]|nr:helix-turn-helix transcriptional regulator [Lachnospiraceae bacterium]
MISYEPLWRTLQDKGVSQYRLIKDYGVSAGQLSRLRSNENVSTHTLNMLCEILDCRLEDIAVYKKDDDGSKT